MEHLEQILEHLEQFQSAFRCSGVVNCRALEQMLWILEQICSKTETFGTIFGTFGTFFGTFGTYFGTFRTSLDMALAAAAMQNEHILEQVAQALEQNGTK